MVRAQTYRIGVKDSIFDPYARKSKERTAYYRPLANRDDLTYYKVWIYLDGDDLPFVKSVKYILHDSFRNRVRIVESESSNPRCAAKIWTWGIFTVDVEIEDLDSRIIRMSHHLSYGDEVVQDGINWIEKVLR